MLVLPAEILDHIFSFLQSDTVTLEACSRSFPILSPLIERHIYTNVTVRDRYDKFFKVLHDRPTVTNHIRALEIKFDIYYIDYLEELSPILPKLPVLRRIELDYTGIMACKWQMLPENFRLAFLECLRLPSIVDISISITFPLSILSHCKHIRHLSLNFFWHDDTAPMAEGDSPCLPTIDSIALHGCRWDSHPSSVSAISSWMESCHLSSLQFSDKHLRVPARFDALNQILISCSHSLINLDVNIDSRYASIYVSNLQAIHPNMAIPIPLAHLRKLQRLTIRAILYRLKNNSRTWQISSPIFAISETLKTAFPLKLLILDLETKLAFHDHLYAQDEITNVLCGPLHSLLVQSASTIDSIHLRFTSIPTQETQGISLSSSAIAAMLTGHSDLAKFVESGKIILTPVV